MPTQQATISSTNILSNLPAISHTIATICHTQQRAVSATIHLAISATYVSSNFATVNDSKHSANTATI